MSARTQQARAEARAQAAAERAAQQRRLRQIRIAATVAVLTVAVGLVGLVLRGGGTDAPSGTAGGGLLETLPPWGPNPAGLDERVAGLAFPPVGDESYHAHALLTVYVDGEAVTVPPNVGFGLDGSHSSLHTHTPDGVVHMEADDPYPYTLREFFRVWGVTLDDDQVGGARADGSRQVFVYENGQPADASVRMDDGDNIVVAVGEPGSFPVLPADDALEAA